MQAYTFTSEELQKLAMIPATTNPGGFMNALKGVGTAVGGAAALTMAGAAADSIIQNTKFFLGRALARRRMNGYLEALGPGVKTNVMGPYDNSVIEARFDSLYRLAPSMMDDPSTAVGLVSDSLRVDETALSPAAAQEMVGMEGVMRRVNTAPGAAAQLMSGLGQQVGGAMLHEQLIEPGRRQAAEDMQRMKEEETARKRIHDMEMAELTHERNVARGIAEALMKSEGENLTPAAASYVTGLGPELAKKKRGVRRRMEEGVGPKTASIDYVSNTLQSNAPQEGALTRPVTLTELDVLMKAAAGDEAAIKQANAWGEVGKSALRGLGWGSAAGAGLGAVGGMARGEGVGDILGGAAIGGIGGGLLGAGGMAGHKALVGKGGPGLWDKAKTLAADNAKDAGSVATTATTSTAPPTAPPSPKVAEPYFTPEDAAAARERWISARA
jgi:hypothetical protein